MMNFAKTVFLLLLVSFLGCTKTDNMQDILDANETSELLSNRSMNERVVVANRISGDISVIDAISNQLIGTYPMPNNGEPMYAVHIPQAKAVFVGDRANDRVVAFDEDDFSVKGVIPAGNGVFHMWAAPNGTQLWVNNDIDNTITIINPVSGKVNATVPIPADLVELGGKPHDVFVDPKKNFAYVSVLGVTGPNDYVIKYKAGPYQEVDRVPVGKDPHLFADDINNLLYVPCQGANAFYVINRSNMDIETIVPFNGAHGVFMPQSGSKLYVADIVNSKLGTFDTANNMQIGSPTDTPFPTAHNLTVNASEDKLFVTHSGGTADQLSIYTLDPIPALETSISVGINPFGLVYYSY